MKRRTFLLAVAVVPTALHGCSGGFDDLVAAADLPARTFEVTRTDAEWRKVLTPDQLGHVFDDGPPPLGKRHCLNGAALRFNADGV